MLNHGDCKFCYNYCFNECCFFCFSTYLSCLNSSCILCFLGGSSDLNSDLLCLAKLFWVGSDHVRFRNQPEMWWDRIWGPLSGSFSSRISSFSLGLWFTWVWSSSFPGYKGHFFFCTGACAAPHAAVPGPGPDALKILLAAQLLSA